MKKNIARIFSTLSKIILSNITKYLKSIEEVNKLLMKIVKTLKLEGKNPSLKTTTNNIDIIKI